ncbi:MAG TPA: transporter substrate-binding domain-containing protein [Vicinamibacteria bacterium]|nr:transporter substrate-binding domain-containing protein [Vicinamibacteria bacterium]
MTSRDRARRSLLLAALLACAPAGFAQDLPEIKKTGRLRVLAVPISEGPTFMSVRNPEDGFDAEILAGFARLHGLQVEVVPVETWDGLVPALTRGRGDVAAGGFTDTAARRAQIAFTVEVFPTRDVVLTRKPNPAVTTLDQLRRLTVGTITGTSMSDAVAAARVARHDDTLPPGGVQAALREGRVQAAVDGLESALVAARHDPEVQIGMFIGASQSLAYGVRKDAPLLRQALDEYLANTRRSGTWNRLAVKYFGPAAPEILRRAQK